MTENNTGQSRSSQHRQPKKKASSPSNKKKILKKVLIGLGAFIGVALIAIIAIFAYYGSTAPEIKASDLQGEKKEMSLLVIKFLNYLKML